MPEVTWEPCVEDGRGSEAQVPDKVFRRAETLFPHPFQSISTSAY